MASKSLASLTLGVVLALTGSAAAAQSVPTNSHSLSQLNGDCPASESAATPVELAQKIAQLNVERLILLETFAEVDPQFVVLDETQSGLQACLTALRPTYYQDLVDAATVIAIESKLTELEAQYTNNQSVYADTDPGQQLLKVTLESLRQNLTALL